MKRCKAVNGLIVCNTSSYNCRQGTSARDDDVGNDDDDADDDELFARFDLKVLTSLLTKRRRCELGFLYRDEQTSCS